MSESELKIKEHSIKLELAHYKNKPYEITEGNRHSNCDYTSYEGFQSEFSLDKVIQRGNLIIDEGNLLAKAGSGEFQKRK